MTVHVPTLNAGLNALSAVFLVAGLRFIRAGRVAAHRACMAAAFVTSTVFLASYLWHHARAGVTRFEGTGWVRTLYFFILTTHTVLAAAVPPLAVLVVWKAWRGDFEGHKRWARRTWPAWMYVSVTGVVITGMLYYR